MEAVKRTVTRGARSYSVYDEGPDSSGWDFWSVFADGSWEPSLDGILTEHLDPTKTFLDVGAWIGPVTLMAARMCEHVHAVEPDPVARRQLEANVSRQRRKNVTIHPVVLAAEDGTARIGRRADRQLGDSMTSTIFSVDAVEVPAVSLETLMTRTDLGNVGLVKIDIEGGEESVLPGAAEALLKLGAPVLLATHALLVEDPQRYRRVVDAALEPFDVQLISGNPDGLASFLVVPR